MRKLMFSICFAFTLLLSACGTSYNHVPIEVINVPVDIEKDAEKQVISRHFYGDFIDVDSGDPKMAFTKSFLIMDCCSTWNGMIDYVRTVPDAYAVEGFELRCYDERSTVLRNTSYKATFHPTDEFDQKDYEDIIVIDYGTKEELRPLLNNDGEIIIESTDPEAIFLVIKRVKGTASEDIWFSNVDDCDGQCSTCGDGW